MIDKRKQLELNPDHLEEGKQYYIGYSSIGFDCLNGSGIGIGTFHTKVACDPFYSRYFTISDMDRAISLQEVTEIYELPNSYKEC